MIIAATTARFRVAVLVHLRGGGTVWRYRYFDTRDAATAALTAHRARYRPEIEGRGVIESWSGGRWVPVR